MDLLTSTLSSLFIGGFLSTIVFGIITIQDFFYFSKFKRDNVIFKGVVGVLWIMQCFQVCVVAQAMHQFLIRAWVNPLLIQVTWQFSYYGTHSVFVPLIVQSLFLYRLWTISKSIITTVALSLLVAIQAGLGMVIVVDSYRAGLSDSIDNRRSWDVISWIVLTAVTDTAIAGSLTVLLRKQRTGFRSTDTALNLIAVYGIQTSAVTGLLAVVSLFTYAVGNQVSILLILGVPAPGIYICCLMANLHTRSTIRARMESATESKQGEHISSSMFNPRSWLESKARRSGTIPESTSSKTANTTDRSGNSIEYVGMRALRQPQAPSTRNPISNGWRPSHDRYENMEHQRSQTSGEVIIIGREVIDERYEIPRTFLDHDFSSQPIELG